MSPIGGRLAAVTNHRPNVMPPVFMVAPDYFVGQLGQRLSIDFHDQAVRAKMRIHPLDGKLSSM